MGPDKGAQLDVIFQTAPDAIITIDAEGLITAFSPAAERIFGYQEAEILGQNVKCLMPEPHRAQHDGYMENYHKTGEKKIIGIGRVVHALRKNGEIFEAELAVGEFKDGEAPVFTGFIRDISDRVEAERRAQSLQRKLDKVARIDLLGEMSTVLAHEINQPLTAISNFARAAKRALGTDPLDRDKLTEYLGMISEQSLRAGEIMKRMRLMVGRGEAQIRPEDINEIIEETVRLRQTGLDRHGPAITLHLEDELPRVLADRIQIQQVLINLVNNAHEALVDEDDPVEVSSKLGDSTRQIQVRAGANHAEVEVIVRDTGPGLPDELRETMFDPLVTTKPSGFGVGLAVCRTIVQAHGGRIWAENVPEGGAAIHFTLPAVAQQ